MCENLTMSKETLKPIKNPPIVEAVVDVECDFAPGQSIIGLEKAATEKFRDRYPTLRKQFIQQFRFEFSAGNPAGTDTSDPNITAFQFLQNDERQLVQLREKGFSFNRLAPYGSLDEYLPEIQRTWDIYRELAAPILVRVVRLRYINRLNLPVNGSQLELDLDSYFKAGPRMPDEDHLAFVGFLNQHQLVETATGHRITTVLSAGNVEGNTLPVIFDNTVDARIDADPGDWQTLEATILSLRDLKNRVFSETLTDKCLSLFQ
jgi:uncharacterized protein (TIGR04255 family)